MTRPVELTRAEAENVVDLIETHSSGDVVMMLLAEFLREQWGMVTREREAQVDALDAVDRWLGGQEVRKP